MDGLGWGNCGLNFLCPGHSMGDGSDLESSLPARPCVQETVVHFFRGQHFFFLFVFLVSCAALAFLWYQTGWG